MINLIPDYVKTNTSYAVKNTRLVRYTVLLTANALAIVVITAFSLLNMSRTHQTLTKEVEGQNTRLVNLKQVETRGQKLYDQISTINLLLDRQIKFSEILPNMATILPPGAILKQLEFASTDLTGESKTATPPASGQNTVPIAKAPDKPFVINAAVTDRTVAATLLENIKARKDLFTSADIIDVSFNTGSSTTGSTGTGTTTTPSTNPLTAKYPYQVTINAYFKKKNSAGGSGTETPIIQPPADRKTEKAL